MEIQKKTLRESQVQLTINVPVGMLHLFSEEVYKKLAAEVRIPGFRPGKAPRYLVEREVGSERFNNEILNIAIQKTFYEAVVKENLVTVGPPEIKVLKFVPTDELVYEAIVAVLPTIKIPDLKKIKLKKQEVVVEKQEIEDVIDNLRKQNAIYKEVKREAKKGDRVEIDFEGKIKGVPFEGGISKNHPLILGSKALVPGFEEKIEGMKKGEEKDIKIVFPEDYHAKHLAGKEAEFHVKLKRIEEVVLPEVDDNFVKKISPCKNLEELKERIESELREGKEFQEKRRLEEELLKKALEMSKIEAPKSLVEDETQRMARELEQNLARLGIEFEKYLEHLKKTSEELKEDLKPEAEKRVKVGLLLSEIVKQQSLSVSDDEINAEIELSLGYSVDNNKREEMKKFYESEEGRKHIENEILAKKAIEWMMSQVEIS